MTAQSLLYESLKNGWTKEFQLGGTYYDIERVRAFEEVSEIFGTRYYLIIDVKKQ